ncbi:MAG: hemerythrin domain-containing protein [Lysobacterales bacterium]|jgi:hemerythrin-like domain-containing protein
MQPKDLHGGLAFFFEQDHRDCDARWVDVEELLDADDIELAQAAWRKYEANMYRHLAMEEEVLLPAIDAKGGEADDAVVEIINAEHEQMRGLLGQVSEAIESGNAEQAIELGDKLLILVQQHNENEESLFYPMAEDLLADEWDDLSTALAEYEDYQRVPDGGD